MIELIETIIKTEEELKNKSLNAQSQAQGIMTSTRKKVAVLAEELENDFQKEKGEKTEIVFSRARQYESELKEKIRKELDLKKQKLEQKRQDLKEKIIKSVLEL